jgi:hypothetical protein
MDAILIYIKAQFDIMVEWDKKFPKVKEEERYTTTKKDTIEFYKERFNFCDDMITKYVTSDINKLTQRDIAFVQIINETRDSLIQDLVKSPYKDDVLSSL